MRFVVELVGPRALPREAFDSRRNQFHADALLTLAHSVRAQRVLAVTDVDLYAGGLNFVFGIAQSGGRACVISLFPLHLGADEERLRANVDGESVDMSAQGALGDLEFPIGQRAPSNANAFSLCVGGSQSGLKAAPKC